MTTVSVPGKITAFEVSVDVPDFDVTPVAGGAIGSPAVIAPSGAKVTAVYAALATENGSTAYFEMDPGFNVGDVVEVYATGYDNAVVRDENGVQIASGLSIRMRKMLTGEPTYTNIGGGTVKVPTWAAS